MSVYLQQLSTRKILNTTALSQVSKIAKEYQATLVAVSKTYPVEIIQEAYLAGVRDFGENRVQELTAKQIELPGDVRWHLIGHLQSNKVKYIASFIYLIHSVDSAALAQEVGKQALRHQRTIDILLQVHIALEEHKFGFTPESLLHFLEEYSANPTPSIRICGLMGMATFTNDDAQIRKEFRSLKTLFDTVKRRYFQEADHFQTLSMGMSGDFKIALEEGSNMIRVGSLIFGHRS